MIGESDVRKALPEFGVGIDVAIGELTEEGRSEALFGVKQGVVAKLGPGCELGIENASLPGGGAEGIGRGGREWWRQRSQAMNPAAIKVFGPKGLLLGIKDGANGIKVLMEGVAIAEGNAILIFHAVGKNGGRGVVAEGRVGDINTRGYPAEERSAVFITNFRRDDFLKVPGVGCPALAEEGEGAVLLNLATSANFGSVKVSPVDLLNAV